VSNDYKCVIWSLEFVDTCSNNSEGIYIQSAVGFVKNSKRGSSIASWKYLISLLLSSGKTHIHPSAENELSISTTAIFSLISLRNSAAEREADF
jgi:hypothetical protein